MKPRMDLVQYGFAEILIRVTKNVRRQCHLKVTLASFSVHPEVIMGNDVHSCQAKELIFREKNGRQCNNFPLLSVL